MWLLGIGVLEAADPHQIALGQPVAGARGVDLAPRRAGTSSASAASPITTTRPRVEPQVVDRVGGDGLGRHDHAGRALQGERAQTQAQAGAQMLAAPLLHVQVVHRDDHRARAVQHRAVDPGGVEDVGVARARSAREGRFVSSTSSLAAAVSRRARRMQRA